MTSLSRDLDLLGSSGGGTEDAESKVDVGPFAF